MIGTIIAPNDVGMHDATWQGILDDLSTQAPGIRVLINLPSGLRLAQVLLNNWRENRVSIPLDPALPAQQLENIKQHSQCHVVVDSEGLHYMDDGIAPWPTHPYEVPDHLPLSPLEHAFILYTSGSTGAPKGVVLSRQAVEANAWQVGYVHKFSPERTHATCLPLFHCNAICMSLMVSELYGNELLITNTRDMYEYMQLCDYHEVEIANIVPTLLHQLVNKCPEWPRKLQYLLTAAAPLTKQLASQFFLFYGACRLVQGYGLTEAVNFSCTMPPDLTVEEWIRQYMDQHPPVGFPMPGSYVGLRNGQVVVKGNNVMSGYWRDEEATRAAFDEDGYLLTGDLGRFNERNYLVLEGRSKETINRNGVTLYPVDVEESLRATDKHLRGTVFRVPDGHGGDEIGLWLENNDELQLPKATSAVLSSLDGLRGNVRPMLITSGEDLPRTATGKPQRNRITARFAVRSEPYGQYEDLQIIATVIARQILIKGNALREHTPQTLYIMDECRRLVSFTGDIPMVLERPENYSPAYDALNLLLEHFEQLAVGQTNGREVISKKRGLWSDLMCKYPMGVYAHMMAEHLIKNDLLRGRVLEVGAGVGNTSRLILDHVNNRYCRSDLNTQLLQRLDAPGSIGYYDFDVAVVNSNWRQEFDTIFATNAVHCARDKVFTLRQFHKMLKPGGVLVLAEGAPYTNLRFQPWALNALFGMFEGWYDRGGFVDRHLWIASLLYAGYKNWGFAQYRSGQHDLGGLLWAQKPKSHE